MARPSVRMRRRLVGAFIDGTPFPCLVRIDDPPSRAVWPPQAVRARLHLLIGRSPPFLNTRKKNIAVRVETRRATRGPRARQALPNPPRRRPLPPHARQRFAPTAPESRGPSSPAASGLRPRGALPLPLGSLRNGLPVVHRRETRRTRGAREGSRPDTLTARNETTP